MKKCRPITFLLILILALALSARAQLFTTPVTNYTPVYATVVITNATTFLGSTNFTGADALVVGQQIGALTNASGVKLFNAAYFTNRFTQIDFQVSDVGSIIPTNIWFSVQ